MMAFGTTSYLILQNGLVIFLPLMHNSPQIGPEFFTHYKASRGNP